MAIAHILAVISAAFFGAPQAVTLSNGLVARDFVAGREWKTVALRCAADGWTVQVDSDELEVELTDGTVITGAEWTLVGSPKHSRRGDTQSLTVALETEKVPGLQATVRYWVRDNEAWMRKQVELRGEPQKTISRIDLEPMTLKLAVQDNSGTGMPILAGRCWFGVEYPGSQNALKKGRLSLVHFPGARLGSKSVASKVAVFGIAGPGQAISVAFENYLTTVITPPRDFTHYNSWYDLRGSELTPSRLLDTYREFQKVLLKPYGLKLAAFVIDDGWQDPKSIWRPRRDLYPEGFGPLARQLEAEGTRLGLWMPLSGQNLDVQWGVAQGYEKSSAGDFYCLAAPRYFAAIRDATARLIREGNLAYYKHDFNHLRCSAPGHQHLPDDPHGREANIDRTIALLQYERELQPGIFLNVTSGMWYSPWWLMWADAIWGAFPGDTGYDRSCPQLTRREWAMSFRDVHLYRMYRQQPNNLFPISRLMTHGITQGEKNMLGGPDEPIREWADYVMMYFGRGVQMKELYLSPGRMRPDMWKAVGMALRWAQRRADILARTTMVGGDPAKGEAYGFVRWLGDRGIWVLRNPSLDEQTVSVPVDQTTGYLGKQRKLYAAVVYPFVSPLADPVEPGKAYLIQAPPASVVVVEVRQEPWGRSVMPPSMRVQASSSKMESGGELVITANATIWAKQAHQPRLYVTLRGGAVGPCKIECQCADERSQTVSGTGWQMTMMPLKDLPSDLQVRIKLPTGERKPFSMQPGEVEAWLVAELPCDTAHLLNPPDDLPWAIADGFRRRSVLLVRRRMEPSGTRVGVADDELHHATAAKLRIDVFGVNAGEYADKWIILNGEKLCRVPFNDQSRLDEWETKIIDLTSDQIKLLKRENEVVLTNEPGDCYKFRNVALAVQLPDGRWAETNWAGEVHCSVAGWLYSEGALFQNAKSRPITLRFSEP